jgi:protein-tyrosine-phosphatase
MTPELVRRSDVIFVMEPAQLLECRKRFPEARARTFLMACLVPGAPAEIQDPYSCGEPVFESSFDLISQAVRAIVDARSGRRQTGNQ